MRTQKSNAGKPSKASGSDRMKGILFILMAAFFFSLMSVFVRLSGDVPTMQKAFFRNIVAAVLAAVLLLRSGAGFYVKRRNLPALLLRCAFGTLGIICNFWAVDHMQIADANMLNKLSPFFAILMSIFILEERPNRIEWISVLLAFIGAAFVAKPGAGIASFPALVGIIGGFAAGTAYTFVRKLGLSGERGPVIVMYFSLFSTVALLPGLIINYVIDHLNAVLPGAPYTCRFPAVQYDIACLHLGSRHDEEHAVPEPEDDIVAVAEHTGLHIVAPVSGRSPDCDPAGGKHAHPLLHSPEHAVEHRVHSTLLSGIP